MHSAKKQDEMREALLVTGGSGLLGLNWALTSRSRYSVTVGLHSKLINIKGVNSRQLNLGSVNSLVKAFEQLEPSVVVHTVALTSVEACEIDRGLAQHLNVELAVNVASACAKVGIPLVHISTDHLFSGLSAYAEEALEPEPVNFYARTKAEAESRVLDIHSQSLVVRTNFYGWGPAYRQSFSDFVIKSLREKREILLFKDVFYTPILAEALVETVHELIDKKAFGIFNVVGDERISKLEFGYRVSEEFGLDKSLIKPGSIRDLPELMQRPHDMSLSNRKAQEQLGRGLGSVKTQIARLRVLEERQLAMLYGV